MVVNRGKQNREVEQIPKSHLSSDYRLQLACMKLELLVILDPACRGEYVPGLVHRPSHHESQEHPKSVV